MNQRKIKFQFWHVEQQAMFQPEQVTVHHDGVTLWRDNAIEPECNAKGRLRQYIGLKDNNGQEIYEGMSRDEIWHAYEAARAKDAELIQQLVDALKGLIFLEVCNEEGLSSGAPTAKDWKKAFDKAQKQIDAAAAAGFKPSIP